MHGGGWSDGCEMSRTTQWRWWKTQVGGSRNDFICMGSRTDNEDLENGLEVCGCFLLSWCIESGSQSSNESIKTTMKAASNSDELVTRNLSVFEFELTISVKFAGSIADRCSSLFTGT